jgi:hypothetical protein
VATSAGRNATAFSHGVPSGVRQRTDVVTFAFYDIGRSTSERRLFAFGGKSMASKEKTAPIQALQFPQWQREYEAALIETDHKILFKQVEVAEAALRTRRETLTPDGDGLAERLEIDKALEKLQALKKDVLKFL